MPRVRDYLISSPRWGRISIVIWKRKQSLISPRNVSAICSRSTKFRIFHETLETRRDWTFVLFSTWQNGIRPNFVTCTFVVCRKLSQLDFNRTNFSVLIKHGKFSTSFLLLDHWLFPVENRCDKRLFPREWQLRFSNSYFTAKAFALSILNCEIYPKHISNRELKVIKFRDIIISFCVYFNIRNYVTA